MSSAKTGFLHRRTTHFIASPKFNGQMHRLPQGSLGKNKPGYLKLLERSPTVALDWRYLVRLNHWHNTG
jgi:hypothetical protein